MRQEGPFDQLMTDTLTLKKTDGRRFEGVKASVQNRGIVIDDVRLPLDVGDCLLRSLPNGSVEEFLVDDPGFQSAMGPIPSHFLVKYRKVAPVGQRIASSQGTMTQAASGRIEKTVFISYRRASVPWAVSIFQDLLQHGFDVFFDFREVRSGSFEEVIFENIRARAHFLVLLTPSALERCSNPTDLFRREIETAISSQRNIVPILLDNFDFNAPGIDDQLGDTLAILKRYNGLPVYAAYFVEAMDRLREYLNVPLNLVLHPVSDAADREAKADQAAASEAPVVTQRELRATEQRYLFTVKIKYRDGLQKIEGTHAEEPCPGSLTVYDGANVVARYRDHVEEWSRQRWRD